VTTPAPCPHCAALARSVLDIAAAARPLLATIPGLGARVVELGRATTAAEAALARAEGGNR
jgi:hypothetical protein